MRQQMSDAQVAQALIEYGMEMPTEFFADVDGARTGRELLAERVEGYATQEVAWQTEGQNGIEPPRADRRNDLLFYSSERHQDKTRETWFKDRTNHFRTTVGPWAKKPAVTNRTFAKHGGGWSPKVWWRTIMRPARPGVLGFPKYYNALTNESGRESGAWLRYTFVPLGKNTRKALKQYALGERVNFAMMALDSRDVARDLCVNLDKGPLFEADLIAYALNDVASKCWADPSADKDRIKNASLMVAQFLRGQDCEDAGNRWVTRPVPQAVLSELDPMQQGATLDNLRRACLKKPMKHALDNAKYAAVIDGILFSGARMWLNSIDARNAQHVQRASVVTGVLFSIIALGTNMIPFGAVKSIADGVSSVSRQQLMARSTAKYGASGLDSALASAIDDTVVLPARSGRLVPGLPDWTYARVEQAQRLGSPDHKKCEKRAGVGKTFAEQLDVVMRITASERIVMP